MTPHVGPASMQEHETVIKALYGSIEKMREHPTYLEVVNRIEYLERLKIDLFNLLEEEKGNVRWYKPISYLSSKIADFAYKYTVDKPISEIIHKLKAQKGLPVGFVVGDLIEQMNKALCVIQDMIKHRNKQYFINDDVYLKEAIKWKESQKR